MCINLVTRVLKNVYNKMYIYNVVSILNLYPLDKISAYQLELERSFMKSEGTNMT